MNTENHILNVQLLLMLILAVIHMFRIHKTLFLNKLFFVNMVDNPFGSPTPQGLRSQVCGDFTKNYPDGRFQAPLSEEDLDHVIYLC